MSPARNSPLSLLYKAFLRVAVLRQSLVRFQPLSSSRAFAPLRTMVLLVLFGLIAEFILR